MTARALLVGVALLIVVLLLAGCGHNTSGGGNEFVIDATVYHVGKHSVTVHEVSVVEASGKARSWFHGKHQIHNNYNNCGWHGRHRVGHEYDPSGVALRLEDFRPGDRVRIIGSIRENASSCGKNQQWHWRPVYISMTKERSE